MSSSSNAPDQTEQSPEESTPEMGGPHEGSADTTECPNCGHVFTGNYCPKCGQEADPPKSVISVIGGFFRDFGDIEHGFGPTFVALCVRPGEVLREYLRGARKGLVSPGWYLLAALIIDIGADRLLAWIGARTLPWTDPGVSQSLDLSSTDVSSVRGDDIFIRSFEEAFAVAVGPQTRFITMLLMAGLLATVLYRLFTELGRMSDALAVGSYLIGHATFLSRGTDLLYVVPAFLYTGESIPQPSFLLVIVLGYLVFAGYQAFGPGWRVVVKIAIAGCWAFALWVSVFGFGACIYALGQTLWYPWGWEYLSLSATGIVGIAIMFSLPLFLHAGLEAYYRLR